MKHSPGESIHRSEAGPCKDGLSLRPLASADLFSNPVEDVYKLNDRAKTPEVLPALAF